MRLVSIIRFVDFSSDVIEDLEALMTSLSVGQKRTMNVGRPPQKISEKPAQNTATAFLADDAGDLDTLMNQLSSKPAQPAGPTRYVSCLCEI